MDTCCCSHHLSQLTSTDRWSRVGEQERGRGKDLGLPGVWGVGFFSRGPGGGLGRVFQKLF